MAKYYLYLDECGDPNLATFDESFPVFTLCGILVREDMLDIIEADIKNLKRKYWGEKDIILHSRDIRKCQRGFEILFNLDTKQQFYRDIDSALSKEFYTIIACSILKEPYIRRFGRANDVYGQSLSFIMERTVFFLESQENDAEVETIIEKRGKNEDRELLAYYNQILDIGTYWVKPERMKKTFNSFRMKAKRDNIIGLQIADLVAYPITRHVLAPNEVNFSYDCIEKNIYKEKDKLMGLRIYPGI